MTTRRSPAHIVPRAFPGIKPDEVEQLIANSRISNYQAGAVLCRENAVEETFYMILDGEVEVTKLINDTEARLLKVLRAGEFFGEMALIHNAPRAATVTASSDLVVLELDKAAFERVLRESTSIALAMVREISRRLRQNDELAIEDLRLRAGELAEAYQKLAEVDVARREFLTNVAHELRTPLMAASGYLQLLQKKMVDGPKLDEAVDAVARNVGQIVTLVNDVLFLQEIELVLPEFQPVELGTIVREVADRYTRKAEAQKVRLDVKVSRDIPPIPGDPKSLERAVAALVDNAIKFSPRGGDVEINLQARRGTLRLEVRDEGIGIAPEALSRIFDRFYHLEKSGDDLFGGLGLGLAITRQVIQQHQGELQVESKPGKGSTFSMIFPLGK